MQEMTKRTLHVPQVLLDRAKAMYGDEGPEEVVIKALNLYLGITESKPRMSSMKLAGSTIGITLNPQPKLKWNGEVTIQEINNKHEHFTPQKGNCDEGVHAVVWDHIENVVKILNNKPR
jgi:hypothetical protein